MISVVAVNTTQCRDLKLAWALCKMRADLRENIHTPYHSALLILCITEGLYNGTSFGKGDKKGRNL